jgi:hypothetical protein
VLNNPLWSAVDTHGGEDITYRNGFISNCMFAAVFGMGDSGQNTRPVRPKLIDTTIVYPNNLDNDSILFVKSDEGECRGVNVFGGGKNNSSYGVLKYYDNENFVVSDCIFTNPALNAVKDFGGNSGTTVTLNTHYMVKTQDRTEDVISCGCESEGGGGEDPDPDPEESVYIAHTDSWSSSSDLTTYTTDSRSFGTASSDRKIVVGISGPGASSRSVSSVTIGGISATKVVGAVGAFGSDLADLWIADVPTGISGVVSATFNASMARCAIEIFSMTGAASSVATDTATNSQSTASPVSANCDIPSNGGAIGICRVVGSSGMAMTWSGLTEASDVQVESNASSVGSAFVNLITGESPRSISVTPSGSGLASTAIAVASWGP